MKLIHISDLHLGKRWKKFSLLEDQRDILQKICTIIEAEAPDAVLVAGDVYDKSIPPEEAVRLFDDFLACLSRQGQQVFIISGNHDSAERIAFGARLMDKAGIHLSPVYNGQIAPVPLTDAYGVVDIYLLPFLKPVQVRSALDDDTLQSYTEAIGAAIRRLPLDASHRSVLVAHQFVTGAVNGGSEDVNVGGLDNVDAAVFAPFDYVALGHIHRAQDVGEDRIRYSGTPLKYSFSETKQEKSVTIVELGAKGERAVRTLPLTPLHEVRELRGTYQELAARDSYQGTAVEDYLHITLTDEEEVVDAIGKLRAIYPNIVMLDYDNQRTRAQAKVEGAVGVEEKTPLALLEELYEKQNNQPMGEAQRQYAQEKIEEIWEVKA